MAWALSLSSCSLAAPMSLRTLMRRQQMGQSTFEQSTSMVTLPWQLMHSFHRSLYSALSPSTSSSLATWISRARPPQRSQSAPSDLAGQLMQELKTVTKRPMRLLRLILGTQRFLVCSPAKSTSRLGKMLVFMRRRSRGGRICFWMQQSKSTGRSSSRTRMGSSAFSQFLEPFWPAIITQLMRSPMLREMFSSRFCIFWASSTWACLTLQVFLPLLPLALPCSSSSSSVFLEMALVITSLDMSTLFCTRLPTTFLTQAAMASVSFLQSSRSRICSSISRMRQQLSLRTDSKPFLSILSCRKWLLLQYTPTYRFFAISRYGQYTFSNYSLIGALKSSEIAAAALRPISIASRICCGRSSCALRSSLNLTITESVSPQITSAPGKSSLTLFLVLSIISRPKAVTEEEISRQGSCPTVAPVKPQTELALTLRASCLPSSTFLVISSLAQASSFLAFLRAAMSSVRISGSSPWRFWVLVTKQQFSGVRVTSSRVSPSSSSWLALTRVVQQRLWAIMMEGQREAKSRVAMGSVQQPTSGSSTQAPSKPFSSLALPERMVGRMKPFSLALRSSWLTTLICWPRLSRKLMGTPVTRAISEQLQRQQSFSMSLRGSSASLRQQMASLRRVSLPCSKSLKISEWCTSSFWSRRKWQETLLRLQEESLCSRCMWISRSSWMRPSMLMSFVSRLPITFDCSVPFFTFDSPCRPNRPNPFSPSLAARSRMQERSKLMMLYPMMKSGSQLKISFSNSTSSSRSSSVSFTSTPEMGEQPRSTSTARYSSSSWAARVLQTQAIWMMGSRSALGKPCSAAHSMSKERTRRGASLAHWPSQRISRMAASLQSTSTWQLLSLLLRSEYSPPRTWNHPMPPSPLSTMKRSAQGMLDSKVWRGRWMLATRSSRSKRLRRGATTEGVTVCTLRQRRSCSRSLGVQPRMLMRWTGSSSVIASSLSSRESKYSFLCLASSMSRKSRLMASRSSLRFCGELTSPRGKGTQKQGTNWSTCTRKELPCSLTAQILTMGRSDFRPFSSTTALMVEVTSMPIRQRSSLPLISAPRLCSGRVKSVQPCSCALWKVWLALFSSSSSTASLPSSSHSIKYDQQRREQI